MNDKTHEILVSQLCKKGEAILNSMTPEDAHLLHMVIGISGEAGELLDAIKKKVIYERALDMGNVIEELGDIEFFLTGLRLSLGISREECIIANSKKLTKRYRGEYTNESAQARLDKAEA